MAQIRTKSRETLIADIQRASAIVPGSAYELSQPIQLRFNELISGVRSDVAVKVFGDDMAVLEQTAGEIAETLQKLDGASEVEGGTDLRFAGADHQYRPRQGCAFWPECR